MYEPRKTAAPNGPKSRRFWLATRVGIPAALVVAAAVPFAVALQMGSPNDSAEAEATTEEVRYARMAAAKTGTEGKMGRRETENSAPADRRALEDSMAAPADHKEPPPDSKTNRSAPKAIDLSDKDLVKGAGLMKLFGSLGGDIPEARGNLFGSRVGDSGGFGGLGLKGTGTGGGGGTIGLGGIGTKGRGGGLSGYGTGFAYKAAAREEYPAEPLKAGATDDNAEFDKYVQFLSTWSDRGDTGVADLIDVRDRHFVKVVDAKGLPIPTASVRIVDRTNQRDTAGTTYGDGRLPFFPRALGHTGSSRDYSVEAKFGGQSAKADWDGQQDLTLSFNADRAINGAIQLDVLFALDTTGSMSDEIDRIKATLLAVTERLRGLPQKFDLRYGAVLYRDVGDDYVTQPLAFTSDVRAFMQSLRTVDAAGGGDEPESVNRALADAVAARWRPGAAKVVFLIGDAPPHMDYGNDVRYGETMKAALAKGIRVHSIAASGLSALGTLVWRQVAQYTRGKFVFIEYGSAQATAEAHGVKGSFKSNNLDDILFEQIRDELEGWGKGEPQPQVARQEPAPEKYAGPIQLHPRGP
jgi:hypothetical protein